MDLSGNRGSLQPGQKGTYVRFDWLILIILFLFFFLVRCCHNDTDKELEKLCKFGSEYKIHYKALDFGSFAFLAFGKVMLRLKGNLRFTFDNNKSICHLLLCKRVKKSTFLCYIDEEFSLDYLFYLIC